MRISLKRAYEKPESSDGCRILVERLWPRGLSKQNAQVDLWAKEAAPSSELRRWFDHRPERWEEFKRRYHLELGAREEALQPILERAGAGPITFTAPMATIPNALRALRMPASLTTTAAA